MYKHVKDNCFMQIMDEDFVEPILKVINYAMKKALLAPKTHNAHVFVYYSPHVGTLDLSAHKGGWYSGSEVSARMSLKLHQRSKEEIESLLENDDYNDAIGKIYSFFEKLVDNK